MLIGSNGGIHIVNKTNNSNSTAIVLDSNGIDIKTGGNFSVNANQGKFIINSAATETDCNLYIADKNSLVNSNSGIAYTV